MRIGYLVFNLDGMGGTSRSAITQANALAGDHGVTCVGHPQRRPAALRDRRPRSRCATSSTSATDTSLRCRRRAGAGPGPRLHERESLLVPERWDGQFTALCDVGLEQVLARARSSTCWSRSRPGLLAAGDPAAAAEAGAWSTRSTAPPPTARPASSRC